MIFQCPLCGDLLDRDIEDVGDGKPFFDKKNRSFKSYCEKYDQNVICREYEE